MLAHIIIILRYINMTCLNLCICMCVQVSSSPASLQLLSILQTLLVLGPDRSDIWLALESITNRAILLAQDGESALQQYIHLGQHSEEPYC